MSLEDLRKPIPIDRVDFRIQSISEKGWALILAYKDARVDMDKLDEALGIGFWQRKHDIINGLNYCSVGVYNRELSEWVWVQDVGVPSKSEATKGEASDAFKRACFNLGSGRELYDYPLILVQLKENEFYTKNEGAKVKAFATFDLRLKDWSWSMEGEQAEGERFKITSLVAQDDKGAERYRFPRNGSQPTQQSSQSAPASQSNEPEKDWYNDFEKDKPALEERRRNGELAEDILKDIRSKFKVSRTTGESILALTDVPY